MSQSINEPIDPQSPIDPTKPGQDQPGVLFRAQVRDQTGASGGSASGAYTSSEHYNRSARGVRLNVVIAPTGAATGTVTVKIQHPDPVTGIWTDMSGATTAAVNGTGALTGSGYVVYPTIPTGSGSAQQHLGPRWRAVATVANTTLTFSVGADYLA